jgi:hypothetical protein
VIDLEHVVTIHAMEAGAKEEVWHRFMRSLRNLHEHNVAHYLHSLRVGDYAYKLSRHEGSMMSHRRFSLFAGCGHDVGKCDIGNEVLDAKDFGPAEREAVKAHPRAGYERWAKDGFLFTAYVAGIHHRFQADPYGIVLGEEIEANSSWLSTAGRGVIESMGERIAFVDFFDAITTRPGPNAERAREVMFERFPGKVEEIEFLFAAMEAMR